MNDIEIANSVNLIDVKDLLNNLNVDSKYVYNYGKYKAKIDLDILEEFNNKVGKLILVTSINPTKYGEGKTTTSIGLVDGFNKLGYRATATLREPSMGPVFGIKGGATGGGYAQIAPMEDINLHFTGDLHAITSANNLLSAIIDNHIFNGNELGIKEVCFRRCLDINDRALRDVSINSKYLRKDYFNITAASEIMAILCLASDFKDLKRRINKIIVGYNRKDEPIYVSDLKCCDAISLLLKDAINPNVVQTLENNLCFVHGGPFANIAHGTSSVVANKVALNMFDYVITEAGFGSDLGAEKFFDIVVPKSGIDVSAVVLNCTVKALKYNGNEKLEDGIANLEYHINNIKKFSNKILVVLNKYDSDNDDEINYIKDFCEKNNVFFAVSTSYQDGGNGSIDCVKKLVELCDSYTINNKIYDDYNLLESKINDVCNKVYGANNIVYSKKAKDVISKFERLGLDKYPICVAKTPSSISDNKDLLGYPKNFDMNVTDIYVNNGAEFIVVLMGDVVTMPGLGKKSAYLNMTISDDRKISGMY